MSRRNLIGAVYRKELLDVLRDRRTLMAMILIPVLLYPLLMLVLYRAAESEQARLEAEHFVIEVPDEAAHKLVADIFADVKQQDSGRKMPDVEWRVGNTPKSQLGDSVQARLAISRTATAPASPTLKAEITYNEVNIRSRTAMEQVRDVLREYGNLLTRQLLGELLPPGDNANGVESILKPVGISTVSTASERQRGGWALGQVLPIILVLMTITGAVYPAIDLTAGERERGTLETIMATPVSTLDLILGKFGVVATIGMITAALNVASVAATMHFSGLSRAISAEMPVQFPISVIPIILLSMIPFALLFAAILVAVCSFARTFKEAQNYVMPVIIIAMMPAFATSLPGIRLQGVMLVLPVGNMVLLTRELFQQTYTVSQILVVVMSTALYAAAAVAVAAKLFGQEAVVFSDSRSYKVLLDRRYFNPAPTPTAAQVLLVIALLFPASFYTQSLLTDPSGDMVQMLKWLAVVQFAGLFVLLPAIYTAWLKIDLRQTFRLQLPPVRACLAALLLGSSSWALAQTFMWLQQRIMRPSSALEEFGKQLDAQFAAHPFWLVALLLAAIPAISEELLFRGFLLSGLSVGLRKWGAIVAAGAIFGIFHGMIDRVPVTALMGILLGYVCWQSRSILPGMIVHVMHNGSVLVFDHSKELSHWLRLDQMTEGSLLPVRVLVPAAILFLLGVAVLATLRESKAKLPSALKTLPESAGIL